MTFTVADLQNLSGDEDYDDNAIPDELDYPQSGGHQPINRTGGAPGQHSEDKLAPADREVDDADRDEEPSFPARASVTIEKPGQGSLLLQTMAQDGFFQIEEVAYFSNPELAHAATAEKDWTRQNLYSGPPFENLDEDLQSFFERYLEERGVNAELANMIPDYVQVKEQKEYVRWLESKYPFSFGFIYPGGWLTPRYYLQMSRTLSKHKRNRVAFSSVRFQGPSPTILLS